MAKKKEKNDKEYFKEYLIKIEQAILKTQDKYKKLEIFLLIIYTLATVVIAVVALSQLPKIAESLKSSKIIIDVKPYLDNNTIPIDIYNVGNAKATNMKISVFACGMKNSEEFIFNRVSLLPDDQFRINFNNPNTVDLFKKVDCSSFSIESRKTEFNITPYKNIKTGEIIYPSDSKSIMGCGYCYWNITVTMDQGIIKKTLTTYSPVELQIEWMGNSFNQSDPNFVPMEPIKIGFLDYEQLKYLKSKVNN